MKTFMLLLVSGILLVGCASASTPAITQVVAFGDDFVDTGNGLQLLKQAVEAGEFPQDALDMFVETTWEGRAPNGPVAVEILANKLNASLTSYGVMRAQSDYSNLMDEITFFQNTGLTGQVDQYSADLEGKQADTGTLFFIVIGGWDFADHVVSGGGLYGQTIADLADQTIAKISEAVTSLAEAGAKQFLVVNTTDLASLPAAVGTDLSIPAKVFQDRLVAQMPVEMEALAQKLQIEIQVFDLVAALNQIRGGAAEYGLANLSEPCFSEQGPCAKPEEYFWWDGMALSARVHKILGEMMAEQISK